MKPNSLKSRIIWIFASSIFISMIGISIISYMAISEMQNNRTQKLISFNIEMITEYINDCFSKMLQISEQLTPQGYIGDLFYSYLSEDNNYKKSEIASKIDKSLSILEFSNDEIKLICYFNKDKSKSYFNKYLLDDEIASQPNPSLYSNQELDFIMGNSSYNRFSNKEVFSLSRKTKSIPGNDYNIYIEIENNLDSKIKYISDSGNLNYIYYILDENNCIVQKSIDAPNINISSINFQTQKGEIDNFQYSLIKSKFNYSVLFLVNKIDYYKEFDVWKFQISIVFVFILFFLTINFFFLWHLVYNPIKIFEKEIKNVSEGNMSEVNYYTGISDYDNLFLKFNKMKVEIFNLIENTKKIENEKRIIEIESITYKINPHFLLNTLNSINWIAKTNNQTQIYNMVRSLSKLLYYNLGKYDKFVTVKEEIDALTEYLAIQQNCYDFSYDINISNENILLDFPIIRFILQPLVENAIFYGLNENGHLEINLSLNVDLTRIEIEVKNLYSENCELIEIEKENIKSTKMGIGLNYVRGMLNFIYKENNELTIDKTKDGFVSVKISIPIIKR